jgi:drug/metabolite transporter (DMT)-like permease
MTQVQPNRTLMAAAAILGYAALISFADNFVRGISEEVGLWQFQAFRSAMAATLIGLAAVPLALRLRPQNLRAVLARSAVHSLGMLMYFGSLGFLSVAQAAAGLFTAPIFVLILSRFVYGHALGPARVIGALVGFAGVLMVLAPDGDEIGLATLLPVLAGAFYAMGNMATREWCQGETAMVLTLWYMIVIGVFGGLGLGILTLVAPDVPPGAEGFLVRPMVWAPSWGFWVWTFVQAAVSVVGVALMVWAYQLAEASRVAIFEYVILPFSALWSYVLFGQTITWVAVAGMGLIIGAGAMLAIRGR